MDVIAKLEAAILQAQEEAAKLEAEKGAENGAAEPADEGDDAEDEDEADCPLEEPVGSVEEEGEKADLPGACSWCYALQLLRSSWGLRHRLYPCNCGASGLHELSSHVAWPCTECWFVPPGSQPCRESVI